jgi:hypothetical protein
MRRIAPIVFVAALLVAAPPAAQAGCGGVQAAGSKRNVTKGPDPLAIGDSVMLLAVNPLAREGFNVNARGCRQWSEGHAILRRKKRRHRLPHLVVMALGTNWFITRDDIGRTRRLLGKRHVLAIVTPREPGGYTGSDAKRIRAAARAHPKRIKVIDWVRFSRGHGSWFGPDGIHLTYTGVTNYVRCIRRSLRFAAGPSASTSAGRHPCASRS